MTATLLQMPRTYMTRTITRLNGSVFATASFTHDGGDIWAWISETVAQECECAVDQVGALEDTVTVDGLPVFFLSR